MQTIDVSGFDTSNVKNMGCMFADCKKLTTLDVSNFDTSNVTDMVAMFRQCSNLTTLDLRSFDTSKLSSMLSMTWMFDGCHELSSLTLGENFKKVTEEAMLYNDKGWINTNDSETIVSGNGKYSVIENSGINTYKLILITSPTNIKAEYSKEFHQVRFTWDKVEGADRYGLAVYLDGKWRVQKQDITGTTYTSPKNLTTGKTYKVAIAARVNGKWDTANAIKNAVTVTIK